MVSNIRLHYEHMHTTYSEATLHGMSNPEHEQPCILLRMQPCMGIKHTFYCFPNHACMYTAMVGLACSNALFHDSIKGSMCPRTLFY